VLIVEDEPMISMMIEDMALNLGWQIVASVHTERDALRVLEERIPAAAILDLKLGSSLSLPVAAACRRQNVPVIFITGYSLVDLPPECAGAPVLNKPFSQSDLNTALQQITR